MRKSGWRVFVGALMVLVAQTAAAAGGFTAGQVMADLNLPADAVARLRISWARLLTKPPGAVLNGERRPEGPKAREGFRKRVFEIDIEQCPRCGGTLKIIAAIEHPSDRLESSRLEPIERPRR